MNSSQSRAAGQITARCHITRKIIQAGFARLGMRQGDTVLVHSSLSRFGYVEGGADAVIDALVETLGPDGTLIMSAITTNVKFVTTCIGAADQGVVAPVDLFDVTGTKTYAGTIAETFRIRPGVKRSWHPTHSVSACGARADEMIANHENAAGPCGNGTPYVRICDLDRGFILLLGVNHMSNTALHGMEELAELEYVLYPKWVRIPILTPHGPGEAHTRVHNGFMGRNLNVFETDYIDGMAQTVTHIGDSYVRFVNAGKMRTITVSALKEDPVRMLNARGIKAFQLMKETGVFTRDPFKPTLN
jgi:aminoglycoside 3-N-acetyltransferase